MSQDQDQARRLAERIARSVSQGNKESRQPRGESSTDVGQELSVMRASLEELQQRLARIESHVTRKDISSSPARRRIRRFACALVERDVCSGGGASEPGKIRSRRGGCLRTG